MNKEELLKIFSKLSISFDLHEHPPLSTVEESKKLRGEIEGAHTKNLFLKNKKNKFFLFTCLESTLVDLKKLKKSLDLGNISFAKEENLMNFLGLKPGAVSPFGLLNDINNEVKFYMDNNIINYKKVSFHPLVNTSTVTIDTLDFLSFMKQNNKLVYIFNFDNYTLTYE